MSYLVACLEPQKDGWSNIISLVSSRVFDNIYLLTDTDRDKSFIANIPESVKVSIIIVNLNQPVEDLTEEIIKMLRNAFGRDKMMDLDIAINISSGNGKEHAALISAIMKLGYGLRFVDIDKDGDVIAL